MSIIIHTQFNHILFATFLGLDPTWVVCRDLRQFSGSKIHIGTGLQLFAKHNKNDQNVNSKRLQLTSTSDPRCGHAHNDTTGGSSLVTIESIKYWIIISLFRVIDNNCN
jgi:hypothetical protein